jgi:LuxR family transcriptional regulator, maltose regulon positive regulatory protein
MLPRYCQLCRSRLPIGRFDSLVPQESVINERLTPREVSILTLLESGLSNKKLAEAIFVSEGTLKWHLHNVYGKLSVKNRLGAMARARTLGIL